MTETAPIYKPFVAIVIVHYQKIEDTLRCLASIENARISNARVIVVDNCSPNGSGEQLKRECFSLPVEIILNPENKGFAAGLNVGLHSALAQDVDFLWILNPDLSIEVSSLPRLLEEANRHPEIGVFGSLVLYPDRQTVWSEGGRVDESAGEVEMRGFGSTFQGPRDGISECDYVPGCAMLVRREVLEKVGYFPEEYFMYFEETDWCLRAASLNVKLAIAPKSIVYHHFEDEKLQSPIVTYLYNRNKRMFFWRVGGVVRKTKLLLATAFRDLPRALRAYYSAPSAEQKKLFLAHVYSCLDFLLGRQGKVRDF